MSLSEVVSQPWMLLKKFIGRIAFKQLQSPADTYGCWYFNKQMHMITGNMQFVNAKPMSFGNLPYENFTIPSDQIKLHRISGIFGLPHKVESVLSERVFGTSQIHFSPPKKPTRNPAHANFMNFAGDSTSESLHINNFTELNIGYGNSSLCFKAEVSLPLM